MAGFGFQATTYSLFLAKQVDFGCACLRKKERQIIDIFINMHMQFGLSPDKVGLVFLASSIPYVTFAPFSGLLADKVVSNMIVYM